jgi:hypothetical protein
VYNSVVDKVLAYTRPWVQSPPSRKSSQIEQKAYTHFINKEVIK